MNALLTMDGYRMVDGERYRIEVRQGTPYLVKFGTTRRSGGQWVSEERSCWIGHAVEAARQEDAETAAAYRLVLEALADQIAPHVELVHARDGSPGHGPGCHWLEAQVAGQVIARSREFRGCRGALLEETALAIEDIRRSLALVGLTLPPNPHLHCFRRPR